ncbi:MAG: carbon-nitrogen hydrolase family protein [Armatimonadetes bacterium]|nr:carbon-nitrogen hydrolase family protein [Armatimonadota bacterium]
MARIAVAQMDPDMSSVEVNLQKARTLVDAAAAQGAELVLLPETALRGQDDEGNAVAHEIPGPAVDELAEMARGANAWVIMGLLEANPDGRPWNSAVVLNPAGDIECVYRKVFLYLGENDGHTPGDSACLLDLGFCTAGLTICYDYIFPEYIRSLVVGGARLLLHATAWQDSDVCRQWNYPAPEAYRAQCLVRALENNIFVASANRARSVDADGNLYMVGRSAVIAPWGEVLAEVEAEEGVAVADLDFSLIEKWSEEAAPYLKDYLAKDIPQV